MFAALKIMLRGHICLSLNLSDCRDTAPLNDVVISDHSIGKDKKRSVKILK